jgi:hypothetical protein
MRLRALAAAVAILVGFMALPPGAAQASPATPSPRLTLASGNCVIAIVGKLECFTNQSDFIKRSTQLRLATTTSCPVFLYTGANYTGTSIGIYVYGQWLNLAQYGFDNATVSFIGNGCGFHLADYQWGGGYWYPGYTGPWGYSANMGGAWNDRVSSVYVS